ncbi:unnamed protein product [Closterium sp. NIES-64]|nr:unnamed protein product [Closterium sp. NIES-64]
MAAVEMVNGNLDFLRPHVFTHSCSTTFFEPQVGGGRKEVNSCKRSHYPSAPRTNPFHILVACGVVVELRLLAMRLPGAASATRSMGRLNAHGRVVRSPQHTTVNSATAATTGAASAKTATGVAVKAAAGGCSASSIAGYTSSVALSGSDLVLHWAKGAGGGSLSLAMEVGGAAASGWVAVAWSPDDRMPGSDAVIGGLPGGAVKAYAIGGYSEAGVRPTSRFSIGSASSANGGSLIKYVTRRRCET